MCTSVIITLWTPSQFRGKQTECFETLFFLKDRLVYFNINFTKVIWMIEWGKSSLSGLKGSKSFLTQIIRRHILRHAGESQNGSNKKAKHAKFCKTKKTKKPRIFLTPWYARVHSFFGKFGVLCYFVTSVLRFALLLYYPNNLCVQSQIAIQKQSLTTHTSEARSHFCVGVNLT